MIYSPVSTAPAASPELLILLASFEARRKELGVKWCKERAIGAIRKQIGEELPANVVVLAAVRDPVVAERMRIERHVRVLLASVCAACGECSMAKR